MTPEKILKIIADNYSYFHNKVIKATNEREYCMYSYAMQGVYCIILDIQKEGNLDVKSLLGL